MRRTVSHPRPMAARPAAPIRPIAPPEGRSAAGVKSYATHIAAFSVVVSPIEPLPEPDSCSKDEIDP